MILYMFLISALAALIIYFRHVYSRFSRYGVKNATPIPPVGTKWKYILGTAHHSDAYIRDYNAFANERFVGQYQLLSPTVLIRDINLIKKITIEDFEHFTDHRTFVPEHSDPTFGRNLFSLKGQEWKDMRSTLSPAFTSSKMKMMLPFMVAVGDQMMRTLKNQINTSTFKYIDLDARDLATRYANDVIASCAFGLKVDSFSDKENQFYLLGRTASTLSYKQTLRALINTAFPTIMKKVKLPLFSKESREFFRSLAMDTMKIRESRNIIRPDMIHLLMEAKKGKLIHEENNVKDADSGFATVEESNFGKDIITKNYWTDDDLIAQASIFFFAGFETVSSTISFLLHELALHPDVQHRLYQEILDFDQKTGGILDYSAIQEMTYMDMVISELLRLWPANTNLDRICVKEYNLGKPNDEATADFIIHKSEDIRIPLIAIHRDPKYFPDPNKFDPERFSDENKHNIQPFTYMPFGLGPRNCIGSRFALCEMKVMTYQLLRAMDVSPCERTQLKARLDPSSFQLRIKGGHWLRMSLRK